MHVLLRALNVALLHHVSPHLEDNGSLSLTEYPLSEAPEYAMLSLFEISPIGLQSKRRPTGRSSSAGNKPSLITSDTSE